MWSFGLIYFLTGPGVRAEKIPPGIEALRSLVKGLREPGWLFE
jgi:hypothetical protein